MLTRASVVCADRIVAARSSNGLRWSSSHTASGYSSASSAVIAFALPLGVRGTAIGTRVVSLGPMVQVQVVRSLEPPDRARVAPFIDELDDHLRLDLAHGPRDGFVASLATDDGRVVGYAQASRGNDGYVVDSVGDSADTRATLLRAVVAELPVDQAITWWTDDST